MKKKKTIIILIASGLVMLAFALPISIYYINLRPEPRNIFDEIYLETEKTYRNDNILKNIKDLDIKGYWPDDDPNIAQTPFGVYNDKKIPNDYNNVSIDFNFKKKYSTMLISFEKGIDLNTKIWILIKYNLKIKTITKTAQIILKKDDSTTYIDKESQVKAYLQKYDITTDDLDHYYNEIVNKKVLPDWCSIYDSKFSPSNYGDITIKTQWKDW
ncbi:MAG: TipC family immunity protein [Streptococcus sp.]|nr:TipC family immunity protein [Streptococcus sp.]